MPCREQKKKLHLSLIHIYFKEDIINVNHQLQRTREMKYIIVSTKTTSGTRLLPVSYTHLDVYKRQPSQTGSGEIQRQGDTLE